jgi:hypothetical protein
MANDFISIDMAGKHAGELRRLCELVRSTLDSGEKVLGYMSHSWDTGDYADLEVLFGIPTGSGSDVLYMVTCTMQALKGQMQSAAALDLIDRVG